MHKMLVDETLSTPGISPQIITKDQDQDHSLKETSPVANIP